MAAISLPIFRLPQPALKNALRQMNLVEHLFLSVLSTKTKQQVTMLNEVEQNAVSYVTSSTIFFILKSKRTNFELSIELDQSNIKVRKCENKLTLSVPGFTTKQWIDHIGCVFLKDGSLTLLVGDPQRRIIENVYEYIRELRIVRFDIDSHEIQGCPLYDMFPLLKCLHFGRFSSHRSILIQNVEEFMFYMPKLTLNEIMLSNCSSISIREQVISDKDLNLVLKHWNKGSNRRLKSFQYLIQPTDRNRFVEAVLLKDVSYTVDENLYWKRFKFEKNDGTNGTLLLSKFKLLWLIICVSPSVLSYLPIFDEFLE